MVLLRAEFGFKGLPRWLCSGDHFCLCLWQAGFDPACLSVWPTRHTPLYTQNPFPSCSKGASQPARMALPTGTPNASLAR